MALTVQKSVVVKTERVNDLLKIDFIATLCAISILCLSLELQIHGRVVALSNQNVVLLIVTSSCCFMKKATRTPITAAASFSLGIFCCQLGSTFAFPIIKLIEQVESVYSVFKYATDHIFVREASQKI